MTTELEKVLVRELREVADGLHVPPMPSLPREEARPGRVRHWQPLLVAAVVVLIVGAVAVFLGESGDGSPDPAPAPTPTPSVTPTPDATIPAAPPSVPYVLDRRLYVDGTQVPGEFWAVESRGGAWLAWQPDGTWWFGAPGVDAGPISAVIDEAPVLSPHGKYVAFVDLSSGKPVLTGFDTSPSGEGLGAAPIDLPRRENGVAVRVRAVTDDGDVIVQGTRTSLMWRAGTGDQQTVVDLTQTAPDQVVLQGTAAGLVVVDGADGATDATSTEPYLATISPDGVLARTGTLPTYDDLEVSPGGTWLVRAPAGTIGGDVPAVDSLSAQEVGSSDEMVLAAPDRWGFATNTWAWEDDETLVAVLLPLRGQADPRLVRCSVTLGGCRAFAGPTTDGATGTATAEQALDAVIEAVVAGDRALLTDQDVVRDGEWQQLVDFAAGQGGSGGSCRDNGSGTQDCEISFAANPNATYYAILEPAQNAYGWRVGYVSIAGA
ncbi:hypothetical protein [Nocardioides sp. LS1]|uniref:hypothetical protein n=1 Tax=Nocardioides sp. LS1 TaxID=1027620 RepID=UPI000F622D21|nr:hypothetical protein [Nocardioides sp. LS1]GCD88560.1 hypothetical protein NLS1_05660 [Nocardioides sp. LS1]